MISVADIIGRVEPGAAGSDSRQLRGGAGDPESDLLAFVSRFAPGALAARPAARADEMSSDLPATSQMPADAASPGQGSAIEAAGQHPNPNPDIEHNPLWQFIFDSVHSGKSLPVSGEVLPAASADKAAVVAGLLNTPHSITGSPLLETTVAAPVEALSDWELVTQPGADQSVDPEPEWLVRSEGGDVVADNVQGVSVQDVSFQNVKVGDISIEGAGTEAGDIEGAEGMRSAVAQFGMQPADSVDALAETVLNATGTTPVDGGVTVDHAATLQQGRSGGASGIPLMPAAEIAHSATEQTTIHTANISAGTFNNHSTPRQEAVTTPAGPALHEVLEAELRQEKARPAGAAHAQRAEAVAVDMRPGSAPPGSSASMQPGSGSGFQSGDTAGMTTNSADALTASATGNSSSRTADTDVSGFAEFRSPQSSSTGREATPSAQASIQSYLSSAFTTPGNDRAGLWGRRQWTEGIGRQLLVMTRDGISSARLRLDPPSLGTLAVQISMTEQGASVMFVSANAAVRDVLEQQTGRLQELFQEQELNLLDVSVSDQERREQQNSDSASDRSPGRTEQAAELARATDPVADEEVTAAQEHYLINERV